MRIPNHIGVIPDGNRRWADTKGLSRIKGWDHGLDPGLALFRQIQDAGVQEVTYYGYTMENARRPSSQGATEFVSPLRAKNSDVVAKITLLDIQSSLLIAKNFLS